MKEVNSSDFCDLKYNALTLKSQEAFTIILKKHILIQKE